MYRSRRFRSFVVRFLAFPILSALPGSPARSGNLVLSLCSRIKMICVRVSRFIFDSFRQMNNFSLIAFAFLSLALGGRATRDECRV